MSMQSMLEYGNLFSSVDNRRVVTSPFIISCPIPLIKPNAHYTYSRYQIYFTFLSVFSNFM